MNKSLYLAIEASLKAGEEILKVYLDPQSDFEIERKADNSPLTVADRKSHACIMSYLQDTAWPVLSEEGRHESYETRKTWHTLWVVDPLDGTKEFIKKNGEFTVNIALVQNGTPILGVIYIPVQKTLYFGADHIGAFRKTDIDCHNLPQSMDALIQTSVQLPDVPEDKHAFTIVASRSHLSAETEAYIREMEKKHTHVETRSSGSSIKICLVAAGIADVYPRFAPTMEWDTAAGHAIARAAGKEIHHTDSDEPLTYNKEDLLNPWFIVE